MKKHLVLADDIYKHNIVHGDLFQEPSRWRGLFLEEKIE